MIDSNVDDGTPTRAQVKMAYAREFRVHTRGPSAAQRIAGLRRRYISATKPQDIKAIWNAVVSQAKSGDRWAIEFVFQRLFGDPVAIDYVEKLEEMTKLMNGEKPELAEFHVIDQEPEEDRWGEDDLEVPNGA